jgi:hypothetical protein
VAPQSVAKAIVRLTQLGLVRREPHPVHGADVPDQGPFWPLEQVADAFVRFALQIVGAPSLAQAEKT